MINERQSEILTMPSAAASTTNIDQRQAKTHLPQSPDYRPSFGLAPSIRRTTLSPVLRVSPTSPEDPLKLSFGAG